MLGRILLSVVLGVVTIASISGIFFLTGCGGRRGWGVSPEKRADWIATRISKELDLNDTQKNTLNSIKSEILARKLDFRSMNAGAVQAILPQLKSDTLDQAKINSAFQDREAKAKETREFLVAKFAEFHRILTPEQKAKLAEKVEKMTRHWQN